MALTTRHRWCIERIKHCFQDQDVEDASIQGFIRKSHTLSKFNALFAGEGNNVLFVHYQVKNASSPNPADSTSSSKGAKAELFVTYGDSTPLTSKVSNISFTKSM